MVAKKKPRKSGANIPEAQRHTVKLQLRVEPEVLPMLESMLKIDTPEEWTRSAFVGSLIEAEFERRKRRKSKPRSPS